MPDAYGCRQAKDYGRTRNFLIACVQEKDGASFVNWLLHIGASAIRQKGDLQGKVVGSMPMLHAFYLAAMVDDLEFYINGEWKNGREYTR